MVICASLLYTNLKYAYGGFFRRHASEVNEYGISAGVIGFVLEVVTMILHMTNALSIANSRLVSTIIYELSE